MTEAPAPTETVLHLTPDEAALLRAALQMLRSTLGREEAEELAEVQALLKRLETARA
jgi:predicted DNA-binding transcriptional regulator YafY